MTPKPVVTNLFYRTERKVREASLSSIQNFLASRSSITDEDARKLWTGLYYAHWMTDRPRPQQALANDLAELLFVLKNADCAAPWQRAFWYVLGGQWTSIEALRLDKFLLLVRRVFAAQLRYAKEHKYKGSACKRVVLDTMREFCFDGEGGASGLGVLALGLRLHLLDLWVDELEKLEILSDESDDAKKFVKDIGKMVDGLRHSPVKPVKQRANESYADERLPWADKDEEMDDDEEEDEGAEDDGEWGGIDD